MNNERLVECPFCGRMFPESLINEHANFCVDENNGLRRQEPQHVPTPQVVQPTREVINDEQNQQNGHNEQNQPVEQDVPNEQENH